MTATASTLAVALDELDTFVDTLTRLTDDDWARPTSLTGWTVADLVAHVAEAAWRQAEAFHRYRLGTTEASAPAPVAADPAALPRLAAIAADHVRAATNHDFEEVPVVPLPFAPLPASIAAQVIAIEYGVHLYDLRRALNGHAGLRAEVARIILEQAPAFLLLIGQDAPDGAGYRLRADSLDLTVTRADGQWQLGEASTEADVCTIEGSDQEIALFIMGRVPGPDGAKEFKTRFPGP